MYRIRQISINAGIAFEQGEKLYEQWTKEEIINEILAIQQECGIEPDFERGDLEKVSEFVLRENCLRKSSWHHVNHRPAWFYVIDCDRAVNVSSYVCRELMRRTESLERNRFRPRLMNVSLTVWENRNNREYAYAVPKTAVVYDGYVYFANGSRLPVRDGVCTCGKSCGSIIREKRDLFEIIVRNMRRKYSIAI